MAHLRIVSEADLPDVPADDTGTVTRRPTDDDLLQMGMKVLVRAPNGDIVLDVPGVRVRDDLPGVLHRKDMPTQAGMEHRFQRATGLVRQLLGGTGAVAHSWGE